MKTVTYDDALWSLVPVEPTEKMIVEGFESEPNDYFTDQNELERYKALSGCRQAAYRASKCWSAMLRAAPTSPEVEQARPVVNQQMTIGVDQSFVNLTPETAAYTTAQPSAQGETVYRSADILKAFNNGFDMGLRQRTSQDRKNDETLADTQRQIIEAAEQRGYERAKSECGQDHENAKRYTWLRDHPPKDCQGGMRVRIWGESGDWTSISGEKLDAAIDAARAAKGADHD